MPVKKDIILTWLKRIQNSELSVSQFFSQYTVPFSRSQYFVYKKKLAESGIDGLVDQRINGGNRKINRSEEAFLQGYVAGGGSIIPEDIQKLLKNQFNCEVTLTTIKRKLGKIVPNQPLAKIGRPLSKSAKIMYNPLGGFELLVAIAYYLEWPQRTTDAITHALDELKTEALNQNCQQVDLEGRNRLGQFTSSYNQRLDVRKNRFASVSEKRKHKNWTSLKLIQALDHTISKKSLAVLSLPIVTGNGRVRTVNLAQGQSLGHFCGFNYKQETLSRFLSELKYLGVSSFLLSELPKFWRKCWGSEFNKHSGPLLCYYIDGNTKALWSSERVKQNKVTMLGRVMGCLEQVFVHDGLGNPIYFETYSGHAPVGEYVLSLFEKIETTILEVPSSNTHVLRVLIMDSANNSVKTIRAFAAQDKYHFITPLDSNQFKEQRERRRSYPVRYSSGDAMLRDTEIELEDSAETGYLISVRAVLIDWDNGKRTVLITNIPNQKVDAHEIVSSYFRRWPAEELQFREQKATVSLNRVAGYGKKEVENKRVKEALNKLEIKKNFFTNKLAKPLEKINHHNEKIAKLIPKERRLRAKTTITDGKRVVPNEIRTQFEKCRQKIRHHELAIKAIETTYSKDLATLRKTSKEWLRLQGKETVFEADVELDQILTYYRASLVHICAYFIKHFLGGESISMVMFFHRVVQLEARIIDTNNERNVVLQNNQQDPVMMASLASALEKLNLLAIRGNNKKIYRFQIDQS